MTQLDASTRANAKPVEDTSEFAALLESGCKPKDQWRIGTEHEKFGFCWKSLKPLPYAAEDNRSIQAILQGLSDKFGWEGMYEGGNLIALKKDGASITLEPGGQFELSGAPLTHLHETCNEVHEHLRQIREVTDPHEIGFIGLGATPNNRRDEIPHMPKGRYTIMRKYMPKVGNLGLDMMHRTSTVQVNLDYASEADMVKKFRTSLALQPLATALFANSPITESKPNGFCSWRANIWTDTDPNRTGMLHFVFEDGFGFERYAEYMMGVPMYFLFKDGDYHDVAGLNFRDFMAGKLPGHEGMRPTIEDWTDHLSTAFPEVRLKTFLEMRGADSGPWSRICALPALWVGLLYDDACLEAAWDLAKNWTAEQRSQLRRDAAKYGLKAKVGKHALQDIAIEAVAIAREGLNNRGHMDSSGMNNESGFVNVLAEIAETGVTPAEVLLENYAASGEDMRKLYEDGAY